MENLDLNDDLYVKMNARGKLLTPFENWKAEFEDFLGKNFKGVKYPFGYSGNTGYAYIGRIL